MSSCCFILVYKTHIYCFIQGMASNYAWKSSKYMYTVSTGNLVTDIMMSVLEADVALLNSGTFRSDRIHPAGEFRKRDLFTLLPLIDPLMVLKVTGVNSNKTIMQISYKVKVLVLVNSEKKKSSVMGFVYMVIWILEA